MNHGRGFTIVELVVVIVVIGILATLATLGVIRFASDGRDTERAGNASTIAEYLEKYYDANGEYPSCTAITGTASSVTSATLKGLDPTALLTPNAPTTATNSIRCGTVLVDADDDFFEYIGDGGANCTGGGSCLRFTLRYLNESESIIKEIKSRRVAN